MKILLMESAALFPYPLYATDVGLLTLHGYLFMCEQNPALHIFILHVTFTGHPKATIKVNSGSP